MLNKERILSHIVKEEEKLELAKIIDKVEWVLKNYQLYITDFIDPYLAALAKDILQGIDKISFVLEGGFPNSERKCIIIYPDFMLEDDIIRDLVFLEVRGNFKFNNVSHRDFLGSVLGIGIKREKVGDIILLKDEEKINGCNLVVREDIADYLCSNLNKVHRVSVNTRIVKKENLNLAEDTSKELFATVASLRLDAIASSGFSASRSQIVKEIEGEKLKLNWRVTTNTSAIIDKGDIISIRGRGRLEVVDILGKSKKERIKVLLKRFI